jgi:hypothetical protein
MKMNKVKKVFVLVLIAAVVSLGLTGCKKKSEHPSGDHPSSEHPTKETPSEETQTEEHPTSEHPTGEHPK